MPRQMSLANRVTGELADLTGRSDAEMKLVLGVGAVVTGVTVVATLAYKTVEFVVDQDLFDH